jgi:LysM repeat protein
MDTISHDNNSSYLPVAGVVVGLLALVLSAVALVKVSSANKIIVDQGAKIGELESLKTQIGTVSDTANKAKQDVAALFRSTQDSVTQIAGLIGDANGKIHNLEEAAKKPAVAEKASAKGGPKEPAVAGPDEYVIKSGDNLAKIAKAKGCTTADLLAVNPGIKPTDLKVGQKIKLPAKK